MDIQTLLQIAQLIGFIVGATVFIIMTKADVKILRVEMKGIGENLTLLNNSFNKLGDVLTQVAVQDNRINRIEDDLKELRHGEGFVRVDGEYTSKGKVK